MLPQLATTVLGLWLMAAPAVLGYQGDAATTDRILGPTIAAIAIVGAAQVTRAVRWLNLPLATWLVVAPVFLTYGATVAANSAATGLAVAALCFARGSVTHRYAGGWAALARPRDADGDVS